MSFLLLTSFFACNQCKRLCSDMADLAESCGYEVTPDMLKDCREQQAGKSFSENGECRTVRPALEEEWDCDEVAVYFDGSAVSSDDSGN